MIGLENGLSSVRRQAIIWTSFDYIQLAHWIRIKIQQYLTFISENEFENAACKKATILSRPQCVNADRKEVAMFTAYGRAASSWTGSGTAINRINPIRVGSGKSMVSNSDNCYLIILCTDLCDNKSIESSIVAS